MLCRATIRSKARSWAVSSMLTSSYVDRREIVNVDHHVENFIARRYRDRKSDIPWPFKKLTFRGAFGQLYLLVHIQEMSFILMQC